jgi:beta-lactamase regulating signal transducer with metallopeptidase domain
MNFTSGFSGMAAFVSERLLYVAVAGTVLAVAVWFLTRLFPKRDSRTDFAIWFSTLVATAFLPLLRLNAGGSGTVGASSSALIEVSAAWAWYIFGVWAVIALTGLARVVLATFQVRKLRREATAIDMHSLSADLRTLIEDFQRSRPVSVLVSERLEVPTAIGFSKPAIILPAWLLESTPAEEVKYILLHELAHLRRRDDWTNLAQKVLKALLFFLPSAWWIERRLSLDREMACDEAVLAHSGTPRGYAECLAHVAEKSFLRRQLALAQAAVGRVRQLTARVAVILDPNRPQSTQLWKPAIPAVIVLAGLCALPASFAPELVSFSDQASAGHAVAASAQRSVAEGNRSQAPVVPASARVPEVRAVPASLTTDSSSVKAVKTNAVLSSRSKSRHTRQAVERKGNQPAVIGNQPAVIMAASYPGHKAPRNEDYVAVREDMYFVVTQWTPSGEQQSWQMHVVQVSVQVVKPLQKPQKI